MEQELQILELQQERPGISDPSIENMGPIPPGWYIIYPSEIEEGNVKFFLEKKR